MPGQGQRVRVSILVIACALLAACVSPERTDYSSPVPRQSLVELLNVSAIDASAVREPTDRHRELQALLGTYKVRVVGFNPPVPEKTLRSRDLELLGSPVAEGEGRVTWALNGRYVRFNVGLSAAGPNSAKEPVRQSEGFIGFDPDSLRYSFTWLSENTGRVELLRGSGSLERTGLQFRTTFAGERAGERRSGRFRLRLLDAGGFVVEQLIEDGLGAVFCTARTTYKQR